MPFRRPGPASLPALALALILGGCPGAMLQASGQPGSETTPGLETKAAGAGPATPQVERKAEPGPSAKAARKAERLKVRFEAGENLRDEDLTTLDLREKDLSGRDLRGWKLAGKDLAGTNLSCSNLRGVSFKGSRLFGVNTLGAVGLEDLSGPLVHPFFRARAGAALGEVEYLSFLEDMESDGDRNRAPRDLAVGPDHRLVFIPATGGEHLCYFPTGGKARGRLAGEDKASGTARIPRYARAAVDSHGQTWVVEEDGTILVLDRGGMALKGGGRLTVEPGVLPGRMVATGDGGMCISYPDGHHILRLEKVKAKWELKTIESMNYQKGTRAAALPNRSRTHTVLYDGADTYLSLRGQSKDYAQIPLPKDTVCVALAQGVGDIMLFAASGPGGDHLGQLVPGKDGRGTMTLRQVNPAGKPRGIRGLAAGPAGRVWYSTGTGQIGYENFETPSDRAVWSLPDGSVPLKILPYGEDRMVFTVEGRCRIGTIQAVDRSGRADTKATAETKSGAGDRGFAAEPYKARPVEPKQVTDLERREWALAMNLRERTPEAAQTAWAAGDATGAATAAGGSGSAPSAATAGGAGSAAAPGSPAKIARTTKAVPAEAGAAAAARTPLERLADLGIELPQGSLDHIVTDHGCNTDPARSQFLERHSTEDGIQLLLAQGIEDCGAIARIRSWNLMGRRLTPCRMDSNVGWFNATRRTAETAGKWRETDLFVVVTEESADGRSQTVITAFPEHPGGI